MQKINLLNKTKLQSRLILSRYTKNKISNPSQLNKARNNNQCEEEAKEGKLISLPLQIHYYRPHLW